MDFPIVIVLIAATFGAVLTFAFISKRATQKRIKDETALKSTLAADKDSKGTPADV